MTLSRFMPFTLSHAAAVLPFSRPLARWGVLSAAVIGSMVPDSRVFTPWHLQRFETHSAMSLFTFSLPLGLAIYWLFQYLIKVPMLEVLPDGAYARWHSHEPPAPIASPIRWLAAACGIFVGALTHLVWDAFTHEGARGVRMLPMQDEAIFDIGHHHLMFARAMQDLSSLLGLLAVIAMLAYGLRRGKQAPIGDRILPAAERRRWIWGILLASLALWAAFSVPAYLMDSNHGVGWLVYDSAIASLRALATAVILFAVAIQLRLRAFPNYRSSGSGR
jgi:hypothetical protein